MEPSVPTDTRPSPGGKSGAAFALLLALLLPAGLFAQLASPLAGLLWTEPFVFLLPAVIATAGSNLDSREWLRLRPAAPRALALAALVGLAGWFLGSAVFAAVRALSPASLVARYDLSRIFEGPMVERVAFAVAATVIAPLCEEVAFRGHLASAFHSRHRPVVAIGATAVLFALLHLDPLRAPSLLALGALYGWLTWRTGSIWPAIVAHAINNGVASALALTMGTGLAQAVEPTLPDALVGVAVAAIAVAAAASIFRATIPAAPAPTALPLVDPSIASTRFRLSLVPRPLVVAALAGWVSLGAILLTALRSRLLLLLCVALPALASARPLVVESRVGEARWAHRPAAEARVGQPVALRVRPMRGGTIRWYRIVPDLSTPYNNAVWPWDPGAYRWIGFAKIRYERIEIDAFRGRWEVTLSPGADAWLDPSAPLQPLSSAVSARVPSAGASERSLELPLELGSHWFQAEVDVDGRTLSSAGLEQNDHRGLSPAIQRVTFRDGDDLVGHLTGFFNVPGVFGSVPWQVGNYVGVDCADVLMAAGARAKGEQVVRDFNVAGLTHTLPSIAAVTLSGGKLSRPLRWGADVQRGDFLAVKYTGWRQFGHVGALYSDRNGDGLLDAGDLVIHAGPSPLHLSTLGGGAFDGELRILRPR